MQSSTQYPYQTQKGVYNIISYSHKDSVRYLRTNRHNPDFGNTILSWHPAIGQRILFFSEIPIRLQDFLPTTILLCFHRSLVGTQRAASAYVALERVRTLHAASLLVQLSTLNLKHSNTFLFITAFLACCLFKV